MPHQPIIGADYPRARRPIVDDEALLEALRQLLRQDPSDHVGTAAGGERHDDANGARRVFVGGKGKRRRARERGDRQDHCAAHRFSRSSA